MARKNIPARDGVYTRKDRPGFWITWYDVQGCRRYRKTDAQNITQAKAILAAEKLRVEQAKALGFAPPGEETFAEIAKRFLEHQKPRVTAEEYQRQEGILDNHLKPFFKGKLAAIRRKQVQRYVTERSGEVEPETVKKELNTLKRLLNLAVEWEIIPMNPAQGVKSPKVPPGRVRYLQPDELRSVLEACPNWLRPIAGLAVVTGLRRGELLGLRWLDIDLNNRRVLLPKTKNGDARVVYLNEMAMTILTSLPKDAGGEVTAKLFGDVTKYQVSMAFIRACRAVKIEDFSLHDMRHTMASWSRMSGADIHTVALLLGHKDLRMAARYQHLSPAFLAEAVNRLDGVFGEFRYPDVTKEKALTGENL